MDMQTIGLLFCKLIILAGLRSLAPGTCFGGDVSTLGLDALLLFLLAIIVALPLATRAKESSSIITIIVAMSVLAAGSAAIVHFYDY